jgi:hypothetical protein
MSALSRLLAASASAASLAVASGAFAAPVAATQNDAGRATILKSLSVLNKSGLEFGELVVAGTGTAVLDPVKGTLSTTGAVTTVGTTAHPAVFTATGSKNSIVIIHVPNSAVTLTRVGGGGTMTVSNWTLDGSTNRRIPLNSAFDFSVGATLNVASGQPDGDYTGTFSITVQYP